MMRKRLTIIENEVKENPNVPGIGMTRKFDLASSLLKCTIKNKGSITVPV
jgi:hypothetical protein